MHKLSLIDVIVVMAVLLGMIYGASKLYERWLNGVNKTTVSRMVQ